MIRNARLTDNEDSIENVLPHFFWQLVYSEQPEKNAFLVHERQEVRDKREILPSSETDQLKAVLRASAGIQGSPYVAGPPGVAGRPGAKRDGSNIRLVCRNGMISDMIRLNTIISRAIRQPSD